MAIDSKDSQTLPLIPPPKRGRGRPPKPDAMTPAERQAKRRARLREIVYNCPIWEMTIPQALEAYRLAVMDREWGDAEEAAKRLLGLSRQGYMNDFPGRHRA